MKWLPEAGRRAGILLVFSLVAGCSNDYRADIIGHWQAENYKLQSVHLPVGPDIVISQHELQAWETALPIQSIKGSGDEVVLGMPGGIGLSFYFENRDRIYFDVPFIGKIYYDRVTETAKPHAGSDVASAAHRQLQQAAPSVQVAQAQSVAAGPSSLGPDEPAAPVTASVAGIVPKTASVETHSRLSAATLPAAVSVSTAGETVPAGRAGPAPLPIQVNDAAPSILALVREAEEKLDVGDLNTAQQLLAIAKSQNASHPLVDYDFAILRMRQKDSDAALRHLNNAFKNGFRAYTLLEANQDFAPLKADVRYEAILARYR